VWLNWPDIQFRIAPILAGMSRSFSCGLARRRRDWCHNS
jgi:hypothetical protein